MEYANRNDTHAGRNLRVMTANIARGEGGDFNLKSLLSRAPGAIDGISALEKIIDEQDVDIGCFQEIESSYIRGENQIERIAKESCLVNYVFGKNFSFKVPFSNVVFTYGNAISSRFGLYNPERITFGKENPSALVRLFKHVVGIKGILHAQVMYDSPEGRAVPINIFCTHFSNKLFHKHEREYEMKVLFENVAKNTPAIVTGDFNTVPLGARNVGTYPKSRCNYESEVTWYLATSAEAMYGVKIQSDPRLNLFNPDRPPAGFPATFLGAADKSNFGKPFDSDWSICPEIIDYVLVVTHPNDPVKLRLKDTFVDYSHRCSDHAPVISDVEIE